MLLYESNEYRATKNWPYAISAGCLIYRHQADNIEVLLLSREKKNDTWSAGNKQKSYHLPKGHVAFDELLTEAAQRESQEEAGCELAIKTYLGSINWDIIHPKTKFHVHKTVHYFAAEWLQDLKEMDTEHDGREWVAIDKAIALLGAPNPKGEDEIIRRLNAFLEAAAV